MNYMYVRTSAWKKNKITMDVQKEAINAKLKEMSLPPVDPSNIYEDRGISGASQNRPGLNALLSHLKESDITGGTLFVYRFNRLSRDTQLMLEILDILEERNIDLVSVMEPLPDNSKMLQNIFVRLYAVVGAFERDVVSENIRLTMANRRSEGKPLSSNTPYGYRFSREKLIPEETELDAVRYIYTLYLSETYGYKKIVRRLSADGYTYRGRPFTELDIYRILSNETYHGTLKGGTFGERYEGMHQTVITKDEFDRVQAIRKQRHVSKKSTRINWLRKKIVCPVCGQHLTPKLVSGNSKFYHYYACANPNCEEKVIKSNMIEKQVKRAVTQFIVKSPVIDRTLTELQVMMEEQQSNKSRNRRQWHRTKDRLYKQFEEGNLSPSKFKESLQGLKEEEYGASLPTLSHIDKGTLEKLLSSRTGALKNQLGDEFYFDLVDKVCLTKEYQIEGIYLRSLPVNILEKEEISL